MRVAVVGGRLQGVEAAYLARKCGWEILLVDKDPQAPAVGLCTEFYRCDVVSQEHELAGIAKNADLIIPALENGSALEALRRAARRAGIPLAFDAEAYAVTASKKRSNLLFAGTEIPVPAAWPGCAFPVVVKPSDSSGSDRVKKIASQKNLDALMNEADFRKDDWIIQEFAEGPSFSLEVLGCEGRYAAVQVTDLAMDHEYDCKRVTAPSLLSGPLKEQFARIAVEIAGVINLTGIMDVEVILNGGSLKVLEIDARLPSQTPAVVLQSTGINMLELLASIFLDREMPSLSRPAVERGVIYEQIKVSPNAVEVSGEHILAGAGPLYYCEDFFGADEAITNFKLGQKEWVATLIVTADSLERVWAKRDKLLENMLDALGIPVLIDPSPGPALIR